MNGEWEWLGTFVQLAKGSGYGYLVGSDSEDKKIREAVGSGFYPNFAIFSYPICFTHALGDHQN